MKLKTLALCISTTLSLAALTARAEETPPATWQEHWFEHNQVVSKVFQDSDVAIYFDKDVSRNATWLNKYVGDVWRYTKQTYGDFGGQQYLYAIFHTGKYGGGHPSTWWDASHDYRNVIDIGQDGDWTATGGWNYGVVTHEISHIVELGSKGVHGSPAFGIWHDSKWAEIFNYDVFLHLGMTTVASQTYADLLNQSDDFPRSNTYWFRDWFYPIYSQYGGNKVLNRYFELLAKNFPKNGNNYSRDMNWGEFVWFWSAAAGTDLKPLATQAFGWPAEWEAQYVKAKSDFKLTTPTPTPTPKPTPTPTPKPTPTPTPKPTPTPTPTGTVKVFQHCDFGGYSASLPVGNYDLDKLRSLGVQNDDLSSVQVPKGYRVTLYQHAGFAGNSVVRTADEKCLVNESFNDTASSIKVELVK
jgi:hypothetical protein